jgi:hypothetical protein
LAFIGVFAGKITLDIARTHCPQIGHFSIICRDTFLFLGTGKGKTTPLFGHHSPFWEKKRRQWQARASQRQINNTVQLLRKSLKTPQQFDFSIDTGIFFNASKPTTAATSEQNAVESFRHSSQKDSGGKVIVNVYHSSGEKSNARSQARAK